MKETSHGKKHHAKVVHHIPGRMRVRLRHGSQHPHLLHQLKNDLSAHTGVKEVEVNEAAGSMTIKYNTQQRSEAGILGLLHDLDVLVGAVTDAPHIEGGGGESSTTALTVAEALDDLNHRLLSATGYTIDLRTLFPLSLIGTGLWQISENGLMFEMIPGWLLVWMGFDALVKLHTPQSAQASPAAS